MQLDLEGNAIFIRNRIEKQNIPPSLPEIRNEIICNYYVSVLGNDNNNGTINKPWKTLKYAISKTPISCNLNIGEGSFNESIIINKSISLIGAGQSKTYIMNTSDKPIVTPIVTVINSKSTIKNLTISGIPINSRNTDGTSIIRLASEGIYVENSDVNIENINEYLISSSYITLLNSTFNIKNIKLLASRTRYMINSDLGIQVCNSQGEINNLENEDHIDHVISFDGYFHKINNNGNKNSTVFKFAKPLTIKNSKIVGRNFNWGDGIRFFGNSSVIIENNQFIGSSNNNIQFPQNISYYEAHPSSGSPNAISIGESQLKLFGNTIQKYPTGIFIQGSTTSVKAYNNTIEKNAIGIKIPNNGQSLILDFGGGIFASPGNNKFNSTLLDVYHVGTSILYAKNNTWFNGYNKIYSKNSGMIIAD